MPLVKWTNKDLEAGKPWDPGWHRVIFIKIEEEAAKDKQSINHYPIFQDTKNLDKYTRKYAYIMNTKNMGMYMQNAYPLMVALGSTPEGDGQFNWDAAYGKELYIEVVPDVYNGQTSYKITGFADPSKVPF